MATVHHATVEAIAPLGPAGRLLTLAWPDGPGFVGGQYVIVDSGQLHPNGKPAKRAYSIVSADRDATRIQLAVKRLHGPTSRYLHEVDLGEVVRFTGPWGQFVPTAGDDRPALVLASATGITAALGLVRAAAFAPRRAASQLLWIVDEALLAPARLAAWSPGVALHLAAPHEDVVERARGLVGAHGLRAAYLTGDGVVVHAVRDALLGDGLDDAAIRVECFFNNPARKVA